MHHRCFLSGGEIVPEHGNLVEELEMFTVLVDSVKISIQSLLTSF